MESHNYDVIVVSCSPSTGIEWHALHTLCRRLYLFRPTFFSPAHHAVHLGTSGKSFQPRGSFHQPPQSKDIRLAVVWSYTCSCKMQNKITVHSHIQQYSWLLCSDNCKLTVTDTDMLLETSIVLLLLLIQIHCVCALHVCIIYHDTLQHFDIICHYTEV